MCINKCYDTCIYGFLVTLDVSNFSLRECASKIFDKKIPGFPSDQRVEFLPVEWRASLKLDEGNQPMK